MTGADPDEWHLELETTDGTTTVTPTLVGEPTFRPALNAKPSAEVPLSPTERYFDATWDEAVARLFDRGRRVAIDLLAAPSVRPDGTRLSLTGGRELDKRVEREVDKDVATDVIRDLVQSNTSYTTNVDYLGDSEPANTVYVGGGDETVYALDGSDGTQRWSYSASNDVQSSPVVVDGVVYLSVFDTGVIALDASSGSLEWSTAKDIGGTTSPTVVDGTVYIGSGGNNVYAIDAADGSDVWTFSTADDTKASSPAVEDGTVYIGANGGTLYAIDAQTGTEEWSFKAPFTHASPTVTNDRVYITNPDDKVRALNPANGAIEWSFDTGARIDGAPTVADGTVFVTNGDGDAYALDAADGTQEWTTSITTASNNPFSGGTVADGRFIVGDGAGTLHALDTDTGSSDWTFTGATSFYDSVPTVLNETVFVSNDDGDVFAVDATNGSQMWSFSTGSYLQSSPTVVADQSGDSIGSRVALETLNHRTAYNYGAPSSGPVPTIRDSIFVGDLADVLTEICERYDLVWELRYDRQDGFVLECTRPGERPTRSIDPPVLASDITKRNDQIVTRAIVEGAAQTVRDEETTVGANTSLVADLDNDDLVSASERVATPNGTVYERGTDYSMNYLSGQITALTSSVGSGAISDGDTLVVDYEYRPSADVQTSGHSGDARHELQVSFADISTDATAQTIAEILLANLSEPYYEGSVEIAPGAREWSLVEELDIAGVPGDPMEVQGVEATDRGVQLRLATRGTIAEEVDRLRSQVSALVRG